MIRYEFRDFIKKYVVLDINEDNVREISKGHRFYYGYVTCWTYLGLLAKSIMINVKCENNVKIVVFFITELSD